MSLPDAWVDRIFAKLAVTYGQRFLGLYAGIDINAVKADWAEELSAYQQSPDAIKHALSCLDPEKAPSVLQFRELCKRAPQYVPKALPAPKVNTEAALAALSAIKFPGDKHPLAWAHRLRDREARQKPGQHDRYSLTQFQREAWREALSSRDETTVDPRASMPEADTLPPAMRRELEEVR